MVSNLFKRHGKMTTIHLSNIIGISKDLDLFVTYLLTLRTCLMTSILVPIFITLYGSPNCCSFVHLTALVFMLVLVSFVLVSVS